jgi:ABC-type transport system involved in multi-copper enzyme maturation permease subunit
VTKILKCDFYRLAKSKLLYGIAAFSCIVALALTLMIRQDIRLGISVFSDITIFKAIDDIINMGMRYHNLLGIFAALFISVFIGQEYSWKTWQHKWIIGKSRTTIYLSKAILSAIASAAIFLMFQATVLLFSGQITEIFTNQYITMIIGGLFVYAALGSVLCMLSMLIKSSIASAVVCLGYVLFSETIVFALKTICGLTDISANVSDWLIRHSFY